MPSPVTAPPSVIVLQLRHDQRHQPVGERGVDQVLVGGHPLHLGGARAGVDREHAVEGGDVEARPLRSGPGTEQVRGALREPDGLAAGDRQVLLSQALASRAVRLVGR